jgi:hypothetical protein
MILNDTKSLYNLNYVDHMASRRDLLKMGIAFVAGLGVGAGLTSLMRPQVSQLTPTGTATLETPKYTTVSPARRKEVFKLGVVTF